MTRLVAAVLAAAALPAAAADWPMFGRDASRNAVSPEAGAPVEFEFPTFNDRKQTAPGRGVAWTAELGSRTVVPPAVANGLVWVCTNARAPADETVPAKDWDGGVLVCLRETDGKELWRRRTPRLSGKGVSWAEDFAHSALGSVPLVEGDRLWYVTNRTEVVCLDISPLRGGTKGEPRVVWELDLRARLKVFPLLPLMHFGFAASVAGYKDKLYVVTHNGVGEGRDSVPAPDAPSLVCLDKATGRVLWKDNSPGKNIIECQVSSPLVCEVGGRVQVVVGQGDGWLRAFDPDTGRKLWECDLNPKDAAPGFGSFDRSYVVATPVFHAGKVYAATGVQPESTDGYGAVYCLDPTKAGDVSRELPAGPGKGRPNPNSAVVWYTPKAVPADVPRIEVGKRKRDLFRELRDFYTGRFVASVTAHDGLVYAGDTSGVFYCFDAATGRLQWAEDLKTSVYGQPLWADGKVYVVTAYGDLWVFAHGRQKQLLRKVELAEGGRAGPVFANGTLYVAGDARLYAIRGAP